MRFNSVSEVEQYFNDNQFDDEVHQAVEFLLQKVNDVTDGQFEGKVITDFYCNGFFGRRYDLSGSVIVQSTSNSITIQDNDGLEWTATFSEGWQLREMAKTIREWTA